MHEIFISYRQDDSAAWAVLLRDALVVRFGAGRVYLDKDSLRAGGWKAQIQACLARSKVVLVPMGPRWLEARTADGQRRLDMPDDVHRWEIAQALALPGVTVIPVLVERAVAPARAELAADIQALLDTQWRELSSDAARREVDIARLVADIEAATGLVAQPLHARPATWLGRVGWVVVGFPVMLVALSLGDALLRWPPLSFVEKTFVYLLVVALFIGSRSLVRSFVHRFRRDL